MIIKVSNQLKAKMSIAESDDYVDRYWITKLVNYITDWRYRKLVRIKDWLKEQMSSLKLQDIIKNNNLIDYVESDKYGNKLFDGLVRKILHLVYSRTVYQTDKTQYGVEEVWQTSIDTWNKKIGDCEDFSILILTLARLCGVPPNRIRLVAGDVEGGGHAWIRYLPDFYPINPVYIDGTYWVDLTPIPKRKFYNDTSDVITEETIDNQKPKDSKYKRIWWGVNDEREYGEFRFIPTKA